MWGEFLGPFPEAGEEEGGWESRLGLRVAIPGCAGTFAPRNVYGGEGTPTLEAAGIGVGVPGRQSCKRSLGEQRKGRTGLVGREMRRLWLGVGEQGWRWAEGVASWGGVSVVGKLAAGWAGVRRPRLQSVSGLTPALTPGSAWLQGAVA